MSTWLARPQVNSCPVLPELVRPESAGIGSEPRIGGGWDGRVKSEAHDERDVVATESEIDRGCGKWIRIGGVGDAGGSETRPYWGIDDHLKRRRMGRAPASRGVTKRGQAPALHRGFVDLAHIAP
jgi:hypothetical protein